MANNNKQFQLLKRIILIIGNYFIFQLKQNFHFLYYSCQNLFYKVAFSQFVHSKVEHCQYYQDSKFTQCQKCYGDLIPNQDRNLCTCPQFTYLVPSSLECTAVCPPQLFENENNMTCSEILHCPQEYLLGQSLQQTEISGLVTFNDKFIASFDQKTVVLWDMEQKILVNTFESNQKYTNDQDEYQLRYQGEDNEYNSGYGQQREISNEFFFGIKFLNERFLIGWTNYRILVWDVQQGYIEKVVGYNLYQINFSVKDANFGQDSIMFKDVSICQIIYLVSDIFNQDEETQLNNNDSSNQPEIDFITGEKKLICNDSVAIQNIYSIADRVYGLTYNQKLFEWSLQDQLEVVISGIQVDTQIISAKQYNQSLWYIKNSTLNILSYQYNEQNKFENNITTFQLKQYENYTYVDFVYFEKKNFVIFKLDTFIQVWFLNKTNNSFSCIQEFIYCLDIVNCKYSNQLLYLKNDINDFLVAFSKRFYSITIFSIQFDQVDQTQIQITPKIPQFLENKVSISQQYIYTYGKNIKQFTDREQNQQLQLLQLLGDVAQSKIYSQNFDQILQVTTSSYNINIYYTLSQNNLIGWNLYQGKAVFNLQFSSSQVNMIAQGNIIVTVSVNQIYQEEILENNQAIYSIIVIRQDTFYKIGERKFDYNKEVKNMMIYNQKYLVTSNNKKIKIFYLGDIDLANQFQQDNKKDQELEESSEFKIYFNSLNGNFVQIFLNDGKITIKNCQDFTKILYQIQIDEINQCEMIKYQEYTSSLILVCSNLSKLFILDEKLQISSTLAKNKNKKNNIMGLFYSKVLNQICVVQREKLIVYDIAQKQEIFVQQSNQQIVNFWQDFADTGKIFFMYDYKKYMIIDMNSSQKVIIQDQFSSANILQKVFYDPLNDRLFYIFQNKTIQHQQFGNSASIMVVASNNIQSTPFDTKNNKVFLKQIENYIIVSNAQNNKIRIYDYLQNTQLIFSIDYQFNINKIITFKTLQKLLLLSSRRSEVIIIDLLNISLDNYEPIIYNIPENELSNVRTIVDQYNSNHTICYYDQLSQIFHIYSFPVIKKLYSIDMKQTFTFVIQFLDLQMDIISNELQILAVDHLGLYYVIFYNYFNHEFSFIALQDKANELITMEYSHLYVVAVYQDKLTIFDRNTGEIFMKFQPPVSTPLQPTYSVDLLYHIFYSNSLGVVLDFENEGSKVFQYSDWPESLKKFLCFRNQDIVFFIEISSIAVTNKKNGDLLYRYRMLDDQNQYLSYKYIEDKGLVIVQFMNNLVGYNILNLQLQFDISISPFSGSFLYKLDTNMILFCNKSDGKLQWIPLYSIKELSSSIQPNNQQLILKISPTYFLMVDDDMVLWRYILGQFESYTFIAKFECLVTGLYLYDLQFAILISQNYAYFFDYSTNGLTQYIAQNEQNYFLVQDNYIFEVGVSYINRIHIFGKKKFDHSSTIQLNQGPAYSIKRVNINDSMFDFQGIIKCVELIDSDFFIFLVSSKKLNLFKSYVLSQDQNDNLKMVILNQFPFAPDKFFVKALSIEQIFVISSTSIYKFSIQESDRIQKQSLLQTAQADLNIMIDETKFCDKHVYVLSKIARKILVLDINSLKKKYEIFTPAINSRIQAIKQYYFIVFTEDQINFYNLNTLKLNQIQTKFSSVRFIYYQKGDLFCIIATKNNIYFVNKDFATIYQNQVENPRLIFYDIQQNLGILQIKLKMFSNLGLHIQDIHLNQMSSQPYCSCYIEFNYKIKKYQQKQIFDRIKSFQLYENQYNNVTINYFLTEEEQPFFINELCQLKDQIRFRLFPKIQTNSSTQSQSYLNLLAFSNQSLRSLMVKDFNLEVPVLTRNDSYHQYSYLFTLESVKISDLSFSNNGFYLSNQYLLIISNLNLTNLTLTGNSLFSFKGQTQILIKNLLISNLTLEENLFEFIDQNELRIENVFIQNIQLKQANIFQISNVHSLTIKNVVIQDCYSLDYGQSMPDQSIAEQIENKINSIFQINGIYSLVVSNITFQRMQNTSFINYNNIFSNSQIYQALRQESIEIYDLSIQNSISNKQLISIKSNKFIIQDSYFFNNTCQTCLFGTAIFLYQTNAFILNVTVKNNTSVSGGAIFAAVNSRIFIYNNSLFQFNEAKAFGGGIFLDYSDLYIDSTSYFKDNVANIGGAIFNQNKVKCQSVITNYMKQFINNTALIYGNNCGYTPSKIVMQDLDGQIKEIDKDNQFNYTLTNFMSGDLIQIRVTLYDEENTIVKISQYKYAHYLVQIFLQRIKIIVISGTNNIKLAGQMILNYQNTDTENNQWIFDDIRIIGSPQGKGFIYLYLENILDSFLVDLPSKMQSPRQFDSQPDAIPYNMDITFEKQNNQVIQINLQFRSCQIGEILIQEKQYQICYPCPEGFYSLQPVSQIQNNTHLCLKCPDEAKSCQGSLIHLKNGYWRENNLTDNILQCSNNPGNCEAESQESRFYCKRGFIGPLCESCDVYGKIWGESYMKQQRKYVCSFIRLLIYIANIVSYEDYSLQKIYYYIPNTVSLPVGNFLYSFDCLFANVDESKIQIAFLRIIWIFVIPLIYAISIIIIYGFMLLYKKQKFNKLFFSNGLFVLLIFLQPNIISSLLETVFCREIGEKKYIQADLQSECLSQIHLKSIAIISIPGLILWIIVIPIGILRKLLRNKSRLDSVSMRFNFGFLFQEYKQKFYYWEFFKSYKKIFIVLINTVIQKKFFLKCSLIGITLLLYLMASNQYRPYKMNRFNRIDRLLIVGLIYLIFLSICQQEASRTFTQITCFIFNIIVYYAFLIYLLYIAVREKLVSHFHTHILRIKLYLKNKFPRIFSCFDTTEPINILRAHKNWKKVANIVKNKRYQHIHQDKISLDFQNNQSPQAICLISQDQERPENQFNEEKLEIFNQIKEINYEEIANIDNQKKQVVLQEDYLPQSFTYDQQYITLKGGEKKLNRLGSATSYINSNNYLFSKENLEINSNQQTIQVLDNFVVPEVAIQAQNQNQTNPQNNSFQQIQDKGFKFMPQNYIQNHSDRTKIDEISNKKIRPQKQNIKVLFSEKEDQPRIYQDNKRQAQSTPQISEFLDDIDSQQKNITEQDYSFQNRIRAINLINKSGMQQFQDSQYQQQERDYQQYSDQNKKDQLFINNNPNQFQKPFKNSEQKQVKRLFQNSEQKIVKQLNQPFYSLNNGHIKEKNINQSRSVKRLYQDSNSLYQQGKQPMINQQNNIGMKSLNQKQIVVSNTIQYENDTLSNQFKQQRIDSKRRKRSFVFQSSESSEDEDSLNSSSEEEQQQAVQNKID